MDQNRCFSCIAIERSEASVVLPFIDQFALAEGEAIEVALDRALEPLELARGRGFDPAGQRGFGRVHAEHPLARPFGPARILREGDPAMVQRELDRQLQIDVEELGAQLERSHVTVEVTHVEAPEDGALDL